MAEKYTFGTEQDGRTYLKYHRRLAKNVTGSLHSKATPRIVKQYANAEPGNERCIVGLFKLSVAHT